LAIAIKAPVLPAENRDVGLALLDRVDGEPHRRLPAATAQRLARFVVHLDHDIGVHDACGGFEPRALADQRGNHRLVAEHYEFSVGVTRERDIGTGHNHSRPEVAPHGIERNSDLLSHDCPGNRPVQTLWCRPSAPSR